VILWAAGLDRAEGNWKIYKTSLKKGEIIIDAIVDSNTTYAITSKAGRRDYGDTLVIFKDKAKDGWTRMYENDFKDLKPWRIDLADLDGDQEKEIITAVCKSVHFDKRKKNRLFVFNYIDEKLVKKWTGSQIAGDWTDYAVGNFVPMDGSELIFIRKTDSGERVSVYYWYDFGFLLFAESRDYAEITDVSVTGEGRILMTYKKTNKMQKLILKAQDGRLVEDEK